MIECFQMIFLNVDAVESRRNRFFSRTNKFKIITYLIIEGSLIHGWLATRRRGGGGAVKKASSLPWPDDNLFDYLRLRNNVILMMKYTLCILIKVPF